MKKKNQKKARERYEDFTKEEKEKVRNKSLSEEQKQKLAESGKNYYLAHSKYLLRDLIEFLKILGQLFFFISWISPGFIKKI